MAFSAGLEPAIYGSASRRSLSAELRERTASGMRARGLYGSSTWIRTTIARLTAGRPAVGRSRIGGDDRNRTRVCRVQTGGSSIELHPLIRLVPASRSARLSPRLQRGAFTRLASRAWSGRRGSNSSSSRWQRDALPLSYVRMVGVARNRTCTAHRRRVTAVWVFQFPTHPLF